MGAPVWLDQAIFPVFVVGSMFVARALQVLGCPNLLVTPLAVGLYLGATYALERLRPERLLPRERDLPMWLETAHFLFNFEFGYGLALLATSAVERAMRVVTPPLWPTGWNVAFQLLLAVTLYEGSSYWQHRLLHRRAGLWPFHVLHHSGAHLDLVRAARFHVVDFFTAAFMAYLPLVVLGTPDDVVTLLAVLVSVLGLLQHGNLRVRTPRWMDLLVCTPAVHRRHHSRVRGESDANFANTFMWFDHLFGSYGAPDPVGPAAMGLEDDPLPAGFWAQFWGPFGASRALRARQGQASGASTVPSKEPSRPSP